MKRRSITSGQLKALLIVGQELFYRSPSCLRNYWRGSPWRRLTKILDETGA